jgi:hypothetical protein
VELFVPLLPLPEIESGVNTESAERIGYRKARLTIIVSVEYQRGSNKIFGIIINNSCTGNQVEIDILYPMFVFEFMIVYFRFLIADTRKKG